MSRIAQMNESVNKGESIDITLSEADYDKLMKVYHGLYRYALISEGVGTTKRLWVLHQMLDEVLLRMGLLEPDKEEEQDDYETTY